MFKNSTFFGNFGFHFGGGDSGHREIPRGGTITMDFDVSLEDLYIGRFIEVCVTLDFICTEKATVASLFHVSWHGLNQSQKRRQARESVTVVRK